MATWSLVEVVSSDMSPISVVIWLLAFVFILKSRDISMRWYVIYITESSKI